MASFGNFVKSMLPSLSELKVKPSFCFPFEISCDPTATKNKEVSKKQGTLLKLRCQDLAGLHKRAVWNGPTS